MDDVFDRYLARIGARRPEQADADALRDLQSRHLMTVPFENIDFHLGVPIELGQPALRKIVDDGRGGTCRELNGSAFADLLRTLGFRTQLLGSRVYSDNELGAALGHTVIRVDTPEPWLVDVGFGRASRYPLRLDRRGPQQDPHGCFEFVEVDHGDLDLLRDGDPVFRVETRPRVLKDFRAALWWYQTAPDSPFRHDLFCSLVTEHGRVTLRGDRLLRTEDGRRTEQILRTDTEIRATYRSVFGITLDRLPRVPTPPISGGTDVVAT